MDFEYVITLQNLSGFTLWFQILLFYDSYAAITEAFTNLPFILSFWQAILLLPLNLLLIGFFSLRANIFCLYLIILWRLSSWDNLPKNSEGHFKLWIWW